MINIEDKKDCNGCTACVNVCPVSCISMQTDDEGFLYAKANEDICIHCSLCVETCPIQSPWDKKSPIKTLGAYNKDEDMCFVSTSGGVFTLLATPVLEDGGVVFGARFNENWQVNIDYVEQIEDLRLFRGSKYVQASVGDSFRKVEKFLQEGRKVLYTGTPCQVAGLNHFLGRSTYNNLLTVDVACHGVPSPMLWERYLQEVKHTYFGGEAITHVNFRYKYDTWRGYRLTFKNKEHTYSVPRSEDPYMRAFFEGLSVREACYYCTCKEGRSHSDITIADFWGAEHLEPEMENDNGLCLVIINSNKGEIAFPYEKVRYKETDLEKAKTYNEGLHEHTKRHVKRDSFFYYVNKADSVIETMEKMMKPTYTVRLRTKISQYRWYLSKIYHRIIGK